MSLMNTLLACLIRCNLALQNSTNYTVANTKWSHARASPHFEKWRAFLKAFFRAIRDDRKGPMHPDGLGTLAMKLLNTFFDLNWTTDDVLADEQKIDLLEYIIVQAFVSLVQPGGRFKIC